MEASSDFAERSVVAVFVVDAAITGMAVIVSAIPSASAAYLFLIRVTNLPIECSVEFDEFML